MMQLRAASRALREPAGMLQRPPLRVAVTHTAAPRQGAAGSQAQRSMHVRASKPQQSSSNSSSGRNEQQVVYNTEFGYSRKDVLIICAALMGFGYAMYYGLQAAGMEAGMAGNWVQLIVVLGLCVGWVSTYLYRVATKQMTYVKQLEAYEDAVMRKRLEEMTEAELEQLMTEVEQEQQQGRKKGNKAPQA